MRRVLGVLSVLLLVCAARPLAAQDASKAGKGEQGKEFQLEQNYPNPLRPETNIPFVLKEALFVTKQPVVVSLKIFNVLQQFVASAFTLNHPSGQSVKLLRLQYSQPGRYEAYWDGKDSLGHTVAPGIYFMQLTVDGVSTARKMYMPK